MQAVLDRHIEVTPDVRGGRARIAGTRISVADVALMHLRLNHSLPEIAGRFDLSAADVYAAMAWYYDHQAEIDADIAADEQFASEYEYLRSSPLETKLANLRNG